MFSIEAIGDGKRFWGRNACHGERYRLVLTSDIASYVGRGAAPWRAGRVHSRIIQTILYGNPCSQTLNRVSDIMDGERRATLRAFVSNVLSVVSA